MWFGRSNEKPLQTDPPENKRICSMFSVKVALFAWLPQKLSGGRDPKLPQTAPQNGDLGV